jgi:hypothetical protein
VVNHSLPTHQQDAHCHYGKEREMKRRTSPLRYLWLLGLLSIALVLLALSGGMTATATVGSGASISSSQEDATAAAYTITSVTYTLQDGVFQTAIVNISGSSTSTKVRVRFPAGGTDYGCSGGPPIYTCNVALANIHASTLPSIDIVAVQ